MMAWEVEYGWVYDVSSIADEFELIRPLNGVVEEVEVLNSRDSSLILDQIPSYINRSKVQVLIGDIGSFDVQ